MIVDGHAHVFRPAVVSPRSVDELADEARDAPVEELRTVMRTHGVEAAVLVPLDPHDDYVREAVQSDPSTFAAVAVADRTVQGRDGGDPTEALRRRRERFGFHALRTQWLGDPGTSIRQSPFFPVLAELAEEGLHLWSYLPRDQFPLLEDLARELPDLRIVLNHLGFCPHDMWVDAHGRPRFDEPFPEGALAGVLALGKHPGIHVMFSGQYALSHEDPPYRDLHGPVHLIAEAFGAGRMLWASDYPWISDVPGYGAVLDLCRQTFPDASVEELADIRGGTALRLFPHLTSR